MTEAQIRSGIADALHKIAPEADSRTLRGDEDLREALDIDSFDFLNLLMAVHERLGVDIPESDYGKVRSLNDFVRYIANALERVQ